MSIHGPLLGDAHKSPDETCLGLRHAFLRASLDDALNIMSLPLLATPRHVALTVFSPVASDTLALWPDAYCCFDAWTRVFLWRGSEASEADEEPCREFIRSEIVETRFPTPTVVLCGEGSSMARFVESRLNPSHNDSSADQDASFPALASLSKEERDAIKAKWLRTDVPSLKQWLRRLAT